MADPIEARMKFIIEQQAQFAADIQMLKEQQAAVWRAMGENTERIRQLVDVTLSLARHAEETDRRLRDLSEETHRRFNELADSHAHSDRRLDALIDTVDKLIRRSS